MNRWWAEPKWRVTIFVAVAYVAAVVVLLWLGGCAAFDGAPGQGIGLQHVEMPTAVQTSGPQTTGAGGINVGTVQISGGAAALIGLGGLVMFALLCRRASKYRKTAAFLVDQNFERNIRQEEKNLIAAASKRAGVARPLAKVVRKQKRKRAKQWR